MANSVYHFFQYSAVLALAEYYRTTYVLLYHFKTKGDPRGMGDPRGVGDLNQL